MNVETVRYTRRKIMKTLRLFFTWPLIFAAAWYFFSFTIAAIVGLAYLHLITILLFHITEKQKEKLIEIVEYIKGRDNLIDPMTMPDLSSVETADDAINAILAIRKNAGIKK
jgi:hypothetical protein